MRCFVCTHDARSQSQRSAKIITRAGGDVSDRLAEALKVAEECVEDCAVAWDDVEELSAAKGSGDMEEVEISAEDKAFIESTKKTITTARAAGQVSEQTLKEIEAAAKGMKEVVKKVNTARAQKLEKALEEAIAAAKECTDDCAVAWETVEEISAAKSREGK